MSSLGSQVVAVCDMRGSKRDEAEGNVKTAMKKIDGVDKSAKIENDLKEILPRQDWTYFSHGMILHGRATCIARRPRCDQCTLARYCPSEVREADS